ncbi:MAG: HesB/IscA family protein [Bradymonadia bacterium]|jgi:iron-sulfur cluster assembly accessory protein
MSELNITPSAIEELRKLHAQASNGDGNKCIRLYLAGVGHDGLDWGMALDAIEEGDSSCECEDFRVVIEEELLNLLGGVKVDYVNEDDESGFKIDAMDPEFLNFSFGGGCCGGGCGDCGGGCGDCGGGCGGCEDDGGCGACGHWDDEEDEDMDASNDNI